MGDGDDHQRRSPGDIVAWRLEAIEKRLDAQTKDQARGFADVARQIAGLTFVQKDVYAADQRTADEIHGGLRTDLTDLETKVQDGFKRVDTRINWSHAVIGTALLGGVVAGIARLAGLS